MDEIIKLLNYYYFIYKVHKDAIYRESTFIISIKLLAGYFRFSGSNCKIKAINVTIANCIGWLYWSLTPL